MPSFFGQRFLVVDWLCFVVMQGTWSQMRVESSVDER